MKISKIFKKWRVIVLLLFIAMSILAISPNFDTKGVAIKNIEINSSAYLSGITNPSSVISPTKLEKIVLLDNKQINSLEDYSNVVSQLKTNQIIKVITNKKTYTLLVKNDSANNLGITVTEIARSDIRLGLDLKGGTRVLLQPATKITESERDDLMSVMRNRLNTYGLTDLNVKKADDLLGNKYILVEIAGVTKQEVRDLIGSQGKFEAKIGDQIVFEGGAKDVTFVCRNDGKCAGIRSCQQVSQNSYSCQFAFQIGLSDEAAKRHANITKSLTVNLSDGTSGGYLSKPLDLLIDNTSVESLFISANLRGLETKDIEITGPGVGATQQEASADALKQMSKLQTILITGSFPTKLNIVKIDSISPSLGSTFTNSAILLGLIAMVLVSIIVYIKYRSLKISIPIFTTLISELIIILGFAALFRYNLDLAAIAGILAAIGTGVDDQIIIADEVLLKETELSSRWKQKIKKAFFIIMAAWAAGVASMLPLFAAGAGLLKGFAISTIIGISIGVFITRPAYAAIIEVLNEE